MIGSHSDAWAFGAIDAGSGTATVLEIAKAFGKLKTEGSYDCNMYHVSIFTVVRFDL